MCLGHDIVEQYGRRDIPVGIEDQIGHAVAENRCAPVGLAHHDAHEERHTVAFNHLEGEIRDVDADMAFAGLAWQPAPAFEIDHQLANAFFHRDVQSRQRRCPDFAVRVESVGDLETAHSIYQAVVESAFDGSGFLAEFAGHAQTRPQGHHPFIPHPLFQFFPFRHRRPTALLRQSPIPRQRLLEAHIFGLRRWQCGNALAQCARPRCFQQIDFHIRAGFQQVPFSIQFVRIVTAGMEVFAVEHVRIGEQNIDFSEQFGVDHQGCEVLPGAGKEMGHGLPMIGLRIQTVIRSAGNGTQEGIGAGGESAHIAPHRRETIAMIKRYQLRRELNDAARSGELISRRNGLQTLTHQRGDMRLHRAILRQGGRAAQENQECIVDMFTQENLAKTNRENPRSTLENVGPIRDRCNIFLLRMALWARKFLGLSSKPAASFVSNGRNAAHAIFGIKDHVFDSLQASQSCTRALRTPAVKRIDF